MTRPVGAYSPGDIEPKWQHYWDENGTFSIGNPGDPGFDTSKPKYYVLDMFPYTSGAGLHVGHPEGYTATDIFARYLRMTGHNVLHPIGWDSFGLPAEQYAITTGIHPRETTEKAIARFKDQLKRFGFSYDWTRELATTDVAYYKWTQWIFLQLFNSWFDDHAAGRDEHGRSYVGKARPISELKAELDAGRLAVGPEDTVVSPDATGATPWTDLSSSAQRQVINNHRIAYMAEVPVNWCPMLGTVLANEEVTNDGRSERGNHPVFKRPLRQWMLRITKYCERLIADIDTVDWPDAIKAQQRNWVGKSTGAEVEFAVDGTTETLRIFTTRPDTLFGATYMVLAPEHPLVTSITTAGQRDAVNGYVQAAARKTELDRTTETREKTGVSTGACAINPVNGQRIPIWVADYVLMGYGTGAIMAVPAHDERDFEFAKQFELPIIAVVQPTTEWIAAHLSAPAALADTTGTAYAAAVDSAYTGDGTAINSGEFNGLGTAAFKQRITDWLEEQGSGTSAINYKLRDWLFSRQRYWGEPFPILHGPDGDMIALDENELPLDLPHMEDFSPHSTEDPNAPPRPPLGKATDWITVERGGTTYQRELNTMPQWAGSCWYYLRYLDTQNTTAPWRKQAEAYWMNVDQYVGGAEHAVLHLLYARFWHKVLFDLGHVSNVEPFQRLFNQGLILSFAYRDRRGIVIPVAEVEERDGKYYATRTGEEVEQIVAKMSKALGNVVNPDIILNEYGADTFRLYEMYMGPLDASKPWNTDDIPGLFRFCNRVWRLIIDAETDAISECVQDVPPSEEINRGLHKLIKKVGEDIAAFKFNTAIAEMIAFCNTMTSAEVRPRSVLEAFVLVLAPFAPHLAEELWQRLGHADTLAYEPWPTYDADLARDKAVEIPVQINGKVKTRMTVPADADPKVIEEMALADDRVKQAIGGQTIRKVIARPQIVNIVVGG